MIVDDLKRAILNEAFTNGFLPKFNFEIKSFKEVFNIVNGFTPSRTDKTLWSNEINWFTVEDYNKQGYLINYTNQHISKKALGKSTNRLLPKGTVILCCTSATIGTSAICNVPMTTNQQFNGLVVKEKFEILPKYIYYFTLTLKNQMKNCSTSTTFPFLSVKKLEEYNFPLTNINEQQRIVDKIEELFSKLDEIRTIEEKLMRLKIDFPKEMKRAILNSAMSEENGVLTPLWKVTAWDKKFKGVEKNHQDKIIKYNYLLASEMIQLKADEGNVYLLSTGNFEGWTTEEKAGKHLSEGEVVAIPWGGSPAVKYYKGKFVTSDNRIATSIDTKILLNKYLYYFMMSKLQYLDTIYRGTSLRHPSMKAVLDMMIPLPSIEKQQQIVNRLEQLLHLCDDIENIGGNL